MSKSSSYNRSIYWTGDSETTNHTEARKRCDPLACRLGADSEEITQSIQKPFPLAIKKAPSDSLRVDAGRRKLRNAHDLGTEQQVQMHNPAGSAGGVWRSRTGRMRQ